MTHVCAACRATGAESRVPPACCLHRPGQTTPGRIRQPPPAGVCNRTERGQHRGRCYHVDSNAGKGDRYNLCRAPYGPFRQIEPVPFSLRSTRGTRRPPGNGPKRDGTASSPPVSSRPPARRMPGVWSNFRPANAISRQSSAENLDLTPSCAASNGSFAPAPARNQNGPISRATVKKP